ncbi:MAG: hypothetical protein RLZZ271_1542, partial [Pseudomonadota bacterium]
MPASEVLARSEFVMCAAVGALGLAGVAHVEEDAGVGVPEFHACGLV